MPPASQPPDTVTSVLARQMKHHGMNISGLSNLKPLMSEEKARADVLPGYHGGLLAATSSRSTGPSGSRKASNSSTKKKKQPAKSVKFQQIGSLLLLLCGMWTESDEYGNDRVELRCDKAPTGPEEEELRGEGIRLLIDEDATGRPLEFSPDWSTQAIDRWLRGLAPKLFQYLDLTYGVREGNDDRYHWRLVRQQHKRVFLFGKELVSGADLGKCLGGQARKKETFRLHIATRQPIDKSVWMNVERAIRVAEKKPVKVDFIDTIERKPHIEDDSSEQDDSSVAGSELDIEAAMEEDTSSDEDLWGVPSKPALADKRGAKRTPLFDTEGDSEGVQGGPKASRSANRSHKELNANGKRRATSPLSPPLYPTRLAKRARRALIESPEPEPEVELEQAEMSDEQKSDKQKSEDAEGPSHTDAFLIDGVDFNVPSSPGGYPFYYSPAPPSPPLLPAAAGPSSHIEPRRTFRESPGRPSKSAWKKRNPS
ncbi:hypothetical protein LXA43DRAFT_1096922 [Ganoderma leucocontextum]|nr:hypothetical protein LXA43DRAFT_1096922 [Ganoderma leucocontextum]